MGEYPFIAWWAKWSNSLGQADAMTDEDLAELIRKRIAKAKLDKAPRTAIFPLEALGPKEWATIYTINPSSRPYQALVADWGDDVLADWEGQ